MFDKNKSDSDVNRCQTNFKSPQVDFHTIQNVIKSRGCLKAVKNLCNTLENGYMLS